ncbi:MAG: DUF2808 domain-containing protein [Microcoleaceae cyanobacterium]
MKRLTTGLALSACLLASLPVISLAQGTQGVTLFGGPDKANLLNFFLQSGKPGVKDRYKLRIPADRLNLAVELISITYPDYYRGKFDPDRIEIRIKDEPIALEEVVWDPENRFIEIYPAEPIPAGNKIEIVMSNVRNPNFGGMFHFNANIRTPGDVPITRYVGTWVLSIN